MLSKDEINKWIIENCTNEDGYIDLTYLKFDTCVLIDNMRVNGFLSQTHQEVTSNLYQNSQTVGGFLNQGLQDVEGSINQANQITKQDLIQDFCRAKTIHQAQHLAFEEMYTFDYNRDVQFNKFGRPYEINERNECVQILIDPPKAKEMTIEEIEEKLGYKISIVEK